MRLVSNVLDRGRRAVRYSYLGRTAPDHLIVHCCHHKVGTVWFGRVFRAVARAYGLPAFFGEQGDLPPGTRFFVQGHSRIDRSTLGRCRGSHLIRDPRDVVVSAYFYHCRTKEPWVHRPNERYGGQTYQQHLLSLDKEAGLLAEIDRCARSDVRDMTSWDYKDDRFLEMRYETLIEDEESGFRELFEHYGFGPAGVRRCVDIALGFSIEKQRASSSHIRSGQPGEWRKHFAPSHREAFKRLTNDAALQLGYESDPNW